MPRRRELPRLASRPDSNVAIVLLAIDVGNTQTVFGLFDGDRLTAQFRVGTDRAHTGDELAVMLRAFVDLSALDGIALCASVQHSPYRVH